MLSCDCDLRCRDLLFVDVVLVPFARRELRSFDFEGLAMASSSSEDKADSAELESQLP